MTPSARLAIRVSTRWMEDCGCLPTQPWWRPNSVAWIVVRYGTSRRRPSVSDAGADLLRRVLARPAGEHVDLDTLAHEPLRELAHVAPEPALDDGRVLPGQ